MSRDWPALNYGDLNNVAGHLLRHAYVQSQKTFSETFKGEDITSLQFGAVDLILLNPGVAHKDLAAALSAAPSVLTTALKPLIASGRLQSLPSDSDRRQSAYHVTATGRAWFKPLQRRLRTADKNLLAGFSENDRRKLLGALRQLTGR